MDNNLLDEIKEVIVKSVGTRLKPEEMMPDFQLAGNILDSMAVTNLILALEEHFDFSFDDDDLSAEAFETVESLTNLVAQKI